MNRIGTKIAMRDPSFLVLTKAKKLELQAAVILYLFRGLSAAALGNLFKAQLEWSGRDCIDFRAELGVDGYLMKNFKLYVYAKITGSPRKAEDYGIAHADVLLLSRVIRSNCKPSLKLVSLCLRHFRDGYKSRSLDGLDVGIHKAILKLNEDRYIEKFIGKKHSFITKTGQKDTETIRADVLEFGLRAVYMAYPKIDNLLHLINTMKTAIKNRGQNIIKEETTQKRLRVVKNDDGTFRGTLLSLNKQDFEQTFALEQIGDGSLSVCNGLMTGLDGSSCEGERPTNVDRKRDLQQVVDRLMSKIKDDAGKRLLTLLMGVHDPEFSEYLGMDNDAAASKLERKQYADKARKFVGMTRGDAQSYVAVWRNQLAEFRN